MQNLQDTHTININGKPKDLKMTFGLLNEISQKVGDIDNIAEISYDADLRNMVLTSLLSERDSQGRITEELNIFNLDVKPEEVVALIDWAGSHVLDFLLNSVTQARAMLARRENELKSLTVT